MKLIYVNIVYSQDQEYDAIKNHDILKPRFYLGATVPGARILRQCPTRRHKKGFGHENMNQTWTTMECRFDFLIFFWHLFIASFSPCMFFGDPFPLTPLVLQDTGSGWDIGFEDDELSAGGSAAAAAAPLLLGCLVELSKVDIKQDIPFGEVPFFFIISHFFCIKYHKPSEPHKDPQNSGSRWSRALRPLPIHGPKVATPTRGPSCITLAARFLSKSHLHLNLKWNILLTLVLVRSNI